MQDEEKKDASGSKRPCESDDVQGSSKKQCPAAATVAGGRRVATPQRRIRSKCSEASLGALEAAPEALGFSKVPYR